MERKEKRILQIDNVEGNQDIIDKSRKMAEKQCVEMLKEAKSKQGFGMVGSETEHLPFPDTCFERIVVIDTFHHLSDQNLSLSELWRVLMPGGRLVIEEPDIRRFNVKLVALVEKLTLFRSHFVSAERIAARLEKLSAQTSIFRAGHNAWIIGYKN